MEVADVVAATEARHRARVPADRMAASLRLSPRRQISAGAEAPAGASGSLGEPEEANAPGIGGKETRKAAQELEGVATVRDRAAPGKRGVRRGA